MRSILAALAIVAATTGSTLAAPNLFDWSGFYVGATAGSTAGSWTLSQYDGRTGSDFDPGENSRKSGWSGVFGMEAGYNAQVANMFVLGAEGDINLNTAHVSPWGFSFDSCGCAVTNTNIYTSLRGRVGVSVDRFLIFATGGVAMGNVHYDYSDGAVGSENHLGFGPTYGAGVEAMVTDLVSVKAEYIHSDFGSPLFFSGDADFQSTVHATSDAVRVGVNFHIK